MLESTQYAGIKLFSFFKSFYNISRLGSTKDVSYFFSDDQTLQNDYTRGLIYAFSYIMIIAAVWFLMLLILRLLGERVGCTSGNPATIPAESMMAKGSFSVHTDETGEFIVMQADQNRVNRTRILYFVSGLYAIVGCGFLIIGAMMMMRSLTSIYDYAVDVQDNLDSMDISSLLATAGTFDTAKADLVTEMGDFCTNVNLPANGLVGGVELDVVSTALTTSLTAVDDISTDAAWSAIETDITDLEKVVDGFVKAMGIVDGPGTLWFILTLCITSALILCFIYMLICAWKSGKEGYQFVGEDRPTCNSKFLHFFATPLFALLLASMWFYASVMFAGQVTNADLCYDEIVTGETVLRVLEERGFGETSDAYVLIDNYLHGCKIRNSTPNELVDSFETNIEGADESLASFQELFPDGDSTVLEAACGGNTADVVTKTNDVRDKLNTLQTDLASFGDHMSCGTMAPIMQKALYEQSCNSLSRGLLWSFISGLCVAFFGTLMLTLRSATQRPQIYIVAPNPASRSDLDEDFSFG